MKRLLFVSLLCAGASGAFQSLTAQRLVFDAGAATVGWLAPNDWGPTFGMQLAAPHSGRTAVVGGLRGVFGLSSQGRRNVVGSAILGVEQELGTTGDLRAYLALNLAASYIWYTYPATSNAQVTRYAGFEFVRPIASLRLERRRLRGPHVGVRFEVQPDVFGSRSVNPSVSFTLSR
jgi:hypothetical protein